MWMTSNHIQWLFSIQSWNCFGNHFPRRHLPSLFYVLSNGLPLLPMRICITCVLRSKLTTQMFSIKIRRSGDRESNKCYSNINNGNLTTECAICMSPWESKMGQRTIISLTVPWVSMDLLEWEHLGACFMCTTLSAVAYHSQRELALIGLLKNTSIRCLPERFSFFR